MEPTSQSQQTEGEKSNNASAPKIPAYDFINMLKRAAAAQPYNTLPSDTLAKKEENKWDTYRGEQDGRHSMKFAALFFHIARCTIVVIAISLLYFLAVWIWHISTPEKWHWLDEKGVAVIERILYSSAIVSLAGRYFSKYNLFGDRKKDVH